MKDQSHGLFATAKLLVVLVVVTLIVSTGVVNCLEKVKTNFRIWKKKLISEMTCYMSSGPL